METPADGSCAPWLVCRCWRAWFSVIRSSPGASRDAQPWCCARLHDAREWSTGPAPERSLDTRDLLQESPDAALRECPSGFPRRAAPLIVSTLLIAAAILRCR